METGKNEMVPTTLQSFLYHDSIQVRTVRDEGGSTWWSLPDVCAALDIRNVQATRGGVKDAHVRTVRLEGNSNLTTVVSEPALYRIIMRSNKPAAEPFQDWIFEDVLPAIRNQGQYFTAEREKTVAGFVVRFRRDIGRAMRGMDMRDHAAGNAQTRAALDSMVATFAEQFLYTLVGKGAIAEAEAQRKAGITHRPDYPDDFTDPN